MTLKHLVFLGPSKEAAIIEFSDGLNVLYGASETGKSFVVESIDFMLGGKKPPRDIPERKGYNMILLAFNTEASGSFTVQRSVDGGGFLIYDGIYKAVPVGIEGKPLSEKHSNENDDNLSATLLKKINLDGKLVKKSASTTRNLSFRDIVRLCVVEETEIQKKSSPIESGQYTLKTAEYSVFKLLLTGIDDSAFISDAKIKKAHNAQENDSVLLDELISNYTKKIDSQFPDVDSVRKELDRVSAEIEKQKSFLTKSEEEMRVKVDAKNALRKNLELAENRHSEILELQERFKLLMDHYNSDLERLGALKESGSLMEALSLSYCPLCGADPNNSRLHLECEGNLAMVVEASDAEASKINTLKAELATTLSQLTIEKDQYEVLIPKLQKDIGRVATEIDHISSGLLKDRNVYAEVVDQRARLQFSLTISEEITLLEKRKKGIEKNQSPDPAKTEDKAIFSASVLDEFSQVFQNLLNEWNFPDADRVHFDEVNRDMVISGKLRTSRGKGLRSITHAAFTVALLEFCKSKELPHPGFVVIDSPLLAYREPEGTEDDLTGTDVQEKFYNYLLALEDGQVIVVENVTPPLDVVNQPSSIMFSKNTHVGRYGFFPNREATLS